MNTAQNETGRGRSVNKMTGSTDEITAGLTEKEGKEFLDAVAVSFCPECGKEVVQNAKGRRKKFCSDECRFIWKKKHPKPEKEC